MKQRISLLYFFGILYIICLWSIVNVNTSAVDIVTGQTSSEDCPYQALPSTLNDMNFLDFNGEFHIHETYYYDFAAFQKKITFTLDQDSAFRIYVAPHVVDIDLWLYDTQSTKSINHTSDATVGGDENLYADLKAGSYELKFLFFGQNKGKKLTCPTIELEIAVTPTSVMQSRLNNYKVCPGDSVLPNLVVDATKLPFIYDSDVNETNKVINVVDQYSTNEISIITSYTFTLPDTQPKYSIDASLGFDFLTGGSLNILIQEASLDNPVDKLPCINANNCTIGVHTAKSHSNIRTVLYPGSYKLFIYDQTHEKDYSISPSCNQFSLFVKIDLAQQVEDFLNCQEYELPKTFNEPGYLNDGGYLYFDEDILIDLSVTHEDIPFTITENSYFRAYIPDYRIDIDIRLSSVNPTTNATTTIASSFKFGGEEEITANIKPGNYIFQLFYFGKKADVFCDTYALEVQIQPISDFIQSCTSNKNMEPPINQINSTLFDTGVYYLDYSDSDGFVPDLYQFMPSTDQKAQNVTQPVTFTIPAGQVYLFESIIESSFVTADIRLVLVDLKMQSDQSDILYVGTHDRNRHTMSLLLYPGDFSLQILTGSTSKHSSTDLPTCLAYSLAIRMTKQDKSRPSCDMISKELPTTLNSPAYLGSSQHVQIAGEFYFPPSDFVLYSNDEISFKPSVDSVFRAYTQYNSIDIDMTLYEGTTPVAWTSKFYEEEALVYTLKANTQYKLRLKYIHIGSVTSCIPYYFGLTISPKSDNPIDTCSTTADNLPANGWIPDASNSPFYAQDNFFFRQKNVAADIQVSFNVPASVGNSLFRAILSSDFIWNNLAFELKSTENDSPISSGELSYNRLEILPLELVPGTYSLRIYEPFSNNIEQLELRNCVDFSLEVGLQSKLANSVNDAIICPAVELPNTFNSIGYMSALSSNSLYYAEKVLARVEDARDAVTFTITQKSMLRIYIPYNADININVQVLNSNGGIIANSVAQGEDIIYVEITPQQYQIVFTYFGLGGALPRPDDCPSFYAFISIAATSDLLNIPSIVNSCQTASINSLPDNLANKTEFSQSYSRSLLVKSSTKVISLDNDKWAHLYVNLDYNDLVSSLAMKIEGSYISSNGITIHKTYLPLYQSGEAFLNEILPPGTWKLSIYDPYSSISPDSSIQCAPFTFSYALNYTSNGKPPSDSCEELSVLPTLLSDIQSFSARKLLMKKSSIVIPISVPTKTTYIRIFGKSDPGSQVLFNLYKSDADRISGKDPIFSTMSSVVTDSNIWQLNTQTSNYSLVVGFNPNKNQDCTYYDAEIALDHFDNIQKSLLCPAKKPNEVDQVPSETVRFQLGSDYYINKDYFFDSVRINNNVNNGIFRYRVTIIAVEPVYLDAEVDFDFLSNDFNLVFGRKNADRSDTKLATGVDFIGLDSDITNKITYQIDTAGTYYLDITENMKYNNFSVVNSCHYFGFSLSAISTNSSLAPRIIVSPENKMNISPDKPLIITLTFSQAVNITLGQTTLLDFITLNNVVLLKSGFATIQPTSATLITKNTQLKLSFTGLQSSTTYQLNVDSSKFISVGGTSYAPINSTTSYTTFSCECNGRGTCDNPNDNGCNCQAPWAGDDCSKCMVGYHGVGDDCVPNSDCNSNTCNGHGTCTNPTGVPQCACQTGFNSPNSTALCGDCAFGYQGYPNCKLIPDQEDTYCYAPILPRNLTHIQYLGFNGKVHLQDNYYIDMPSGSHDTFITIKAESLLRVYTEPHHVDVDLWLYSVTENDDLIGIVDRSITFNREEVLLVVLQPGYYRISFKYFNWNKVQTTNCETFNLELAIDDIQSLQNATDSMNTVYSCTNQPVLPTTILPNIISGNLNITDNSVFKLDAKPSNQVVYLYNTTFTVAPSQEGNNILADIELSYQFLIGDISMVIVSGNNTAVAPSCKGSTNTAVSGCVFGDNELNRNIIHATLYPGDYVLYLYAPEYTNITGLSCVLFNFKAQFNLIKDDEDYFNCLGEPIPTTLNTPEFLGFVQNTDNYLHIQDFYLMDKKAATINFETTNQTLVRIHAQQTSAINTLSLLNLATGDIYNKYSDTIYMNIAAGAYQITITSNRITTAKNFCPVVNLEIAIEPSDIPLLLNDDCPANNKASVPTFTASVPFIFENGTTHKHIYTVPFDSNQVVAMYSFTLGQVCQFYSAVASEFLRGNLRVNLYTKLDDSSLMLTTKGLHDYNYNWIQQDLEPGQYVLKIERPQYTVTNNNQPKCIPFEFEFSLLPLSKLPMCPGEPIPLDFNSVRFLGSEGRMHYQSDNLVIPPSSLIYTNIAVPIMVAKKSILRLYVNPHIVDIDIKLLDATNKNETIISGSNLLNTEEAFVTLLDKISQAGDTQPKYYIQFQFWRWSSSIPTCNTFSLEIAVAPVDEINISTSCPQGTTNSIWPVIQTNFDQGASYNYSNVLTNTQLYFQQSTSGPVSKSYSITTKSPSNIHIQVGYKFLTGDLAVKLVSTTKTKKTYYGVSAPNRNILEVVNLPAGTYTLTIAEPYTSYKDIVGCSYFNFEFYMEPYVNLDQEDGFYHYLPENLNTYAYLSYNNHVHLQGEYMMYDGVDLHNQVEFTLFEESLIRVQASILPDNEVNSYNETNIPTIFITDGAGKPIGSATYGSYVTILGSGNYILHFGGSFFSVSNVPVDVEIAIALIPQVEKFISNIPYPSNCTLSPPMSIVPSKEDGTFYYHEMLTIPSDKMFTSSIILSAPFTLNVPSRVYIQIGYQFLLGDLNVQITNDDVTLNFIGKANRNTNEINAELPPGQYDLVITSIGGVPSTITEHCTPYYLAIVIRDISSDIHADCSIYNAIPWDLNRADGGSSPFGGPIDENGFVRIYSDDFIAPSNAAQRNISFGITQDTFVNIFTIDNLAASIDVDVFTQDTAIDQDLIFYTSLHSSAQRSSVYLAKASSSSKMDISLDFTGISKGSCPAFGLQIVTKPASYLTDQLLCPANFISKLPNASPKLDTQGTFTEYISSYFTGDYISKHQIKTNFEYYIDFNLTKTSRIEASFSFDSIASNFYLKLASRNGNTRNVIGTGDWTAELSYGETSMTSTIATSNLRAGSYSLIISHPPAINPLSQSSSIYNDLCLPFTYSFVVMDNSKVYVGSFSPSNGHNIDPNRDLVLQFSTETPHYNSSGSQIICENNSTIANSFYLASQTSSDKVYPTSVLCLQEDGTKWQMTFSNTQLDGDTTYVLTLVDGQIFDSNGNQSILPPQNVYNFIDTTCSNNGGYQNGRCVCATGYGGVDCGYCGAGYHNINSGTGSPICVSQTCKVNTCGCDPNISGTCIALGKCLINQETDSAYCICSKQYNGTTCQSCAAGYINYPYCEPHFECGSCGKGSCDYSTGTCKCPSNFQGSQCDECADGYHGSDCAKNGSGAIIALEVIATLVAVSIVIGVGIWYVRTRYRSGVARYKMLPKFEFEDDDRTTKFPGLYDDEDDDLQFNNGDKKDTSINRGGSGKTHVFSFSSMPVSALDSDDSDEERLTASNNTKNQNNKHLFDM